MLLDRGRHSAYLGNLCAQECLSKIQTTFPPQWVIVNQNRDATGLIGKLESCMSPDIDRHSLRFPIVILLFLYQHQLPSSHLHSSAVHIGSAGLKEKWKGPVRAHFFKAPGCSWKVYYNGTDISLQSSAKDALSYFPIFCDTNFEITWSNKQPRGTNNAFLWQMATVVSMEFNPVSVCSASHDKTGRLSDLKNRNSLFWSQKIQAQASNKTHLYSIVSLLSWCVG